MEYQVTAEIPNENGVKTIVTVRAQSFTGAWLKAEEMKAQGWRVLSAPMVAEWPTFPVDLGSAA